MSGNLRRLFSCLQILQEKNPSFFHIFATEHPAVGGTAFMVSKLWCPNKHRCHYSEVVPGRFDRLYIQGDTKDCVIWNLHHYKANATEMNRLRDSLLADVAWSEQRPEARILHVTGDLNIVPGDMPRLNVRDPEDHQPRHRRTRVRDYRKPQRGGNRNQGGKVPGG